ncbi:hypothetical protein HOY80DRAFT_383028 [Tuber brumale]|nr:hypothetical protein HOY80DRAFT_383028 [Tuber brumale]
MMLILLILSCFQMSCGCPKSAIFGVKWGECRRVLSPSSYSSNTPHPNGNTPQILGSETFIGCKIRLISGLQCRYGDSVSVQNSTGRVNLRFNYQAEGRHLPSSRDSSEDTLHLPYAQQKKSIRKPTGGQSQKQSAQTDFTTMTMVSVGHSIESPRVDSE